MFSPFLSTGTLLQRVLHNLPATSSSAPGFRPEERVITFATTQSPRRQSFCVYGLAVYAVARLPPGSARRTMNVPNGVSVAPERLSGVSVTACSARRMAMTYRADLASAPEFIVPRPGRPSSRCGPFFARSVSARPALFSQPDQRPTSQRRMQPRDLFPRQTRRWPASALRSQLISRLAK